jgi:UDP-N-acetylmuramoylalanine--D-glutamate ligase
LDWHGTYDRYVADKLNLFAHRADLQLAINARSHEAVDAASRITGAGHRHLYGPAGRVEVAGDGISIDGVVVPALSSVCSVSSVSRVSPVSAVSPRSLRGRHNLDNLCGAITACRLLTGAWPDFDALAAAVAAMPPLPSRLETVAVTGDLEFVDDTLASNPAGTIAALEALAGRRLSLICGGHDRRTDFRGLAAAIDSFGGVDAVTVVLLGDAGERLSSELTAISSAVTVVRARTVSEAVALAVGPLESRVDMQGTVGRVVLFSPAAPTPPSEGTYVERSAEFRRAVRHQVGIHGEGDSAAC